MKQDSHTVRVGTELGVELHCLGLSQYVLSL